VSGDAVPRPFEAVTDTLVVCEKEPVFETDSLEVLLADTEVDRENVGDMELVDERLSDPEWVVVPVARKGDEDTVGEGMLDCEIDPEADVVRLPD
jgi:hypothetical protein